jgi:hypothetical protein
MDLPVTFAEPAIDCLEPELRLGHLLDIFPTFVQVPIDLAGCGKCYHGGGTRRAFRCGTLMYGSLYAVVLLGRCDDSTHRLEIKHDGRGRCTCTKRP